MGCNSSKATPKEPENVKINDLGKMRERHDSDDDGPPQPDPAATLAASMGIRPAGSRYAVTGPLQPAPPGQPPPNASNLPSANLATGTYGSAFANIDTEDDVAEVKDGQDIEDLFNRYKKSSTHANKRSQVVVAIKQEVFGQFGKRPAPSELPGAVGMNTLDTDEDGADGKPRRSAGASPLASPNKHGGSSHQQSQQQSPSPQRDQKQAQQERQSSAQRTRQHVSIEQDDQQNNSPSNSVPSVRSQKLQQQQSREQPQQQQQQQRVIQATRSTSTENGGRGGGGGRRGGDDLSDD